MLFGKQKISVLKDAAAAAVKARVVDQITRFARDVQASRQVAQCGREGGRGDKSSVIHQLACVGGQGRGKSVSNVVRQIAGFRG